MLSKRRAAQTMLQQPSLVVVKEQMMKTASAGVEWILGGWGCLTRRQHRRETSMGSHIYILPSIWQRAKTGSKNHPPPQSELPDSMGAASVPFHHINHLYAIEPGNGHWRRHCGISPQRQTSQFSKMFAFLVLHLKEKIFETSKLLCLLSNVALTCCSALHTNFICRSFSSCFRVLQNRDTFSQPCPVLNHATLEVQATTNFESDADSGFCEIAITWS